MRSLKSTLFIVLLIFTEKGFSYVPSEGDVTAIFGPFVSKTIFNESQTKAPSPTSGGVALIVNGDINDKSALEISMIHMTKLFFRTQDGHDLAEETELIHITMGYRRWLSPTFSLAAAVFSSYSLGDYRTVHSDFPAGTDIDTSARDITEYGFDFSLQTELWTRERLSLILDTQYSLSTTSKANEKSDHYAVVLGIKYVIQDKQSQILKAVSSNKH